MNLALINLAAFSYQNVLEPFYPPLKGNSVGDKSFGLSGCRWQHSREMQLTGGQRRTHTHTLSQHIRHPHTHTFSLRGRHGDPHTEKPCDPTGTKDMLFDPSGEPQQRKSLPLSSQSWRRGRKKQNSITQSKPTLCPQGVISAPFKSLITHKTNNILTPW